MNNALIADAISAAGIAILVLDEADQIIECNPPAGRLLGHAPEQLIGLPASSFLSLLSDSHLAESENKGAVHETLVRNSPNNRQPLAVNIVCWTDMAGRKRSTITLRDRSAEREMARHTQRELIQSDNAIRGANIAVFEYDPAAKTVTVSAIWRQMLELEPDEDIDVQVEWRRRVHPEDLMEAIRPIDLCVEGLAERASCEYRLQARDRTHWRWMRTDIAVANRDETGRATLLVGAQTDITERKLMEESLRISVEQFRSAFENAPIGKAIVGLDGSWQRVNPALCTLLGYTESELLSTNFQSLTYPEDLEADLTLLKRLMNGEIPSYMMEKRYRRANGMIMWALLSVGMVRSAEGKPDHFITQVLDITQQRRLTDLKNEFVAIVSHELRTPLTGILGALTLLTSYEEATFSDEVQRLLFIAKTNGDRLHYLINDILDFQKFSAGQMRFSIIQQQIAPLIEESLLANSPAAAKCGVRYCTIIPDRSLRGLVDSKRFHQVMANLLSNAAKFADPGSAIEVLMERHGLAIKVSVKNTGPGIPDAFQDRVFRPFSQASSISDLRSGGTGLGLSITKQIVEQMGGEIGFESVPNRTTVFWFTIRSDEVDQF